MSKMGISTLQSYKGAQIFEALGSSSRRCGDVLQWHSVQNRWGVLRRHPTRCGRVTRPRLVRLQKTDGPGGAWTGVNHEDVPQLPNPGQYHFRNGGEVHLNTPMGMVSLQAATKSNSRDTFLSYCREVDEVNAKSTLRGVLAVAARRVG